MEATVMEATAITVLDMGDTTPAMATMDTQAMAIRAIQDTAIMAIAAMAMATHLDSSMGDLSLIVVTATMANSKI